MEVAPPPGTMPDILSGSVADAATALGSRVESVEAAPVVGSPKAPRGSFHRQTLEGSFSAVSKPFFASKYAFKSSRRDLHNALLCSVL